jgi:hypothetical protein
VTIRGILLTGAGVTTMQNKDLQTRADISGEITSATNYTAGGTGILVSNAGAGTTIAKDDANDRVNITLAGATIAGTSITAGGIIYFVSRGGASSADELLSLNDFGGNVTSTNADYLLQTHIMRIQN